MSFLKTLASNYSIKIAQVGETPVHFQWLFVFFFIFITGIWIRLLDGAVIGIVASTLFFLSYLAHELTHVLVAEHFKLGKGFYIYILGFMPFADFDSEDLKPFNYFWMKVSSLLTTALISFAFFGLAIFFPNGDPYKLFHFLSLVNFGLLAFNGLPFEPLDGGAFITVPLWKWTGNKQLAMKVRDITSIISLSLVFIYSLLHFNIIGGFLSSALLYSWFNPKNESTTQPEIVNQESSKTEEDSVKS
jgi:Zn-dependent protease